jgi:hypothetical protein
MFCLDSSSDALEIGAKLLGRWVLDDLVENLQIGEIQSLLGRVHGNGVVLAMLANF